MADRKRKGKPNGVKQERRLIASVRDDERFAAFLAAHDLTRAEGMRVLLDMVDDLKRRGVKVRRIPSHTELEFPR